MKTICGAKTRSGQPCQKPPVKGAKRCRLHGGATPRGADSPHFKTGLYSRYAPAVVRDKLAHFLDADPFDLTNELALTRALLAEFLARYEHASLDAAGIYLMSDLLGTVRKTVDTIARIKNDTALTAAELTYVAVRLAGLLDKYIADETQREACKQELFALALPGASERNETAVISQP